ncbi:carbonic anhydrase [Spirosoma montaniterrae]|uniref:Carbonic anhydrase n=1 Tax=Spirosoma montaniterrae TaxID=1178516 RepID=A0A1P9WYK0_9BACT|nr:carbonic anhydrase [Spirosoma montaniterrae]AQG80433.1 carbonic anhydrase [Spirosoma montaniterrae]
MSLYEKVFENNREWVASQLAQDPTYFSQMALGQEPEFLYIGCSDSRVQPENFMGVSPGEVFVYRNVANLIPNNDISSISVTQYAVEYLHVKHIIVCGHYGCGGVRAALDNKDLGKLNIWLRNIDDVYRLHRDELNALPDENARFRRLVELNVQEQCLNIMKFSFVQHARAKGEYPRIHGWVYDIATGTVKDLEIDMSKFTDELKVYQLK